MSKFKVGDLAYREKLKTWYKLEYVPGMSNEEVLLHGTHWFDSETGDACFHLDKIFTVNEMSQLGIHPPQDLLPKVISLDKLKSEFSIKYNGQFISRDKSDELKNLTNEGRCPQCKELGKYIALAPVCSKHGPY